MDTGDPTTADLRARLQALREEHRRLDAAVAALQDTGVSDQLKIARMKKRKLELKDAIFALQDEIEPDIIA